MPTFPIDLDEPLHQSLRELAVKRKTSLKDLILDTLVREVKKA